MPKSETASFLLKLFGGFELSDGSGDVRLRGDKLKALLAVLASEFPKAQRREHLMALLWGTHADKQARQNLRQALGRLRKATGKDLITTDGDLIGLAGGLLTIDVHEFERTVSTRNVESAKLAIDLFDGTFLPDIDVREQLWEEWLRLRREKLDGLAVDAMILVGDHHLDKKQYSQALELGQRALVLDYFREDGHCLVMRSLLGLKRRSQALQHYRRFADDLDRELGVGPEETTIMCRNEIGGTKSNQAVTVQADVQLPPSQKNTAWSASPELPVVAVLPFENLSIASKQDYFVDGISDEIIAALANLSWFYTIARSSSFQFRGRSVNIRHVGRILGARYILEGSVQKTGKRVRVIPHLIDADTGVHVWADRFDSNIGDIFELHDQITLRVLTGVVPALQQAEIVRLRECRSENPTAYDCYLRALPHFQAQGAAELQRAAEFLSRARECDSKFGLALAMEANCYWRAMVGGWHVISDSQLKKTFLLAEQSISNSGTDPVVLAISATILGEGKREHEVSLKMCREALRIAPFHPVVLSSVGWMEMWSAEFESAIEHLCFVEQFFPCGPGNYDILTALAAAYHYSGRHEEGLEWAQRATSANPNHAPALRYQTACLAQLGRIKEARSTAEKCLTIQPHCTITKVRQSGSMMARYPEMLDPYLEGLHLAGIPD
jgi:TolB-like protein